MTLDDYSITISAAGSDELESQASVVTAAAEEHGVSLERADSPSNGRKHMVGLALVAKFLLDVGVGVAIGVIANAIYDRVKRASTSPARVIKQEEKTTITITDESTGTRIVIAKHTRKR